MKAIILSIAAIAVPCCNTSCVVETVRTITTDKAGLVTETTVTTTTADPVAASIAATAAGAYLPRPTVIREEKSGSISLEEIENRREP
jgi:hypothetical protein